MARFLSAVVLGLVAAVLGIGTPAVAVAQPARGAETDTELVRRVQKGIEDGVKYLKDQAAKNNGHWDEGVVLKSFADMNGGPTALAVLALLNAGVPPDDPTVAGGLKYLRDLKPTKTYVVALQTMALSEALALSRDKRDLPLLQKNVEWFQQKAIRSKAGLEGWSYPANAVPDNSNTQYALLGLYAAKTAGVKIDDALWREVQEFYTRTQGTDPQNPRAGFWLYHNAKFGAKEEPSFTMSVGGVCGLLIASMGLDASEQGLDPKTGLAAKCGQYPDNSALAKGLFWVGAHFSFEQGKSYFYNYYGLERLGRLSGQRFIGTYDWYRQGCQNLLGTQDPTSGAFVDRTGKGLDQGYPVITTSFALLFLSKGRTPVLVTKFAWGRSSRDKVLIDIKGRDRAVLRQEERSVLTELNPDGRMVEGAPNWNRKHHDCRNVVEFAQREIFDGAPLSWQVYDPRMLDLTTDADIDFEVGLLVQSPVLYLNGHGPMDFVTRPTEKPSVPERMLKKYVEEGGFLFVEACCGDKDFRASFEKLVDRIMPGSQLKKLPPEHAIWGMFPGVDPNEFPDLMCVERGCRTVAVFSPSPLAGYWEERKYMPADGRVPKSRGEMAFCLSRNVIAYATGMELPKPKLTRTLLVAPDTGIARSKFRALQLQYVSDTSQQLPPAADALRNLMAYLGDKAKLDVALTSAVMVPASPDLSKYKFMYLHGRKPIAHRGAGGQAPGFSPDELDNIKANLQTGGLLLADAACNGNMKEWRAFDKSFRDAMAQMFPDAKLQVIPPSDPLYKVAAQAGIDLGSVKCRRENAEGTGPEKEMRSYPVLLEGIKIDEQVVDGKKVGGRWAVVYSKYDIGCAIEGHKSGECLGHDKESALRIASAVALYSLRR